MEFDDVFGLDRHQINQKIIEESCWFRVISTTLALRKEYLKMCTFSGLITFHCI